MGAPLCPEYGGITTIHPLARLEALYINSKEELGGNEPAGFAVGLGLSPCVCPSPAVPRTGLAGPMPPPPLPTCRGFSAFQRALLVLTSQSLRSVTLPPNSLLPQTPPRQGMPLELGETVRTDYTVPWDQLNLGLNCVT